MDRGRFYTKETGFDIALLYAESLLVSGPVYLSADGEYPDSPTDWGAGHAFTAEWECFTLGELKDAFAKAISNPYVIDIYVAPLVRTENGWSLE